MPAVVHAGFLILFVGALLLPAVVYCSLPASLTLERAFPVNQIVELGELRARDRARHGRILQSSGGVINFPVYGSSNPSVGLYFTKVKLGSPPKEFNVQIDTGSDILWVACSPCDTCPKSSGLNIQLNLFDPATSSTASVVSCPSDICSLAVQMEGAACSSGNSRCEYSFKYGDGSGTSGFYVSDMLNYGTYLSDSLTTNSSASIIFGCSNYQSGDLTKPDKAVDGIIGFGKSGLSVISQLSSQGVAPKIFSHCLAGSNNGGGVLVFGEIVEPNIVYTPLVPSQPHYNLNLQSIAINGQTVPIDPAVFATSSNSGTIVDSGTTLAYLAGEAYDPFVTAINNAVSQSVSPSLSKGCYPITSSVDEIFPVVSLNFKGGASMILSPVEYLMPQNSVDGTGFWCMGFQRAPDERTILGDLVLRDKIVVYDVAHQRVGWTNYNCSLSVHVSLPSGKGEFVNTGQVSLSSSSQDALYTLTTISPVALLVHIYLFGQFLYLYY